MTQRLPGWTVPLADDGWVGEEQRFPTARQVVCWTDCPTCGAEKGTYCSDGRMNKKTGEIMDLADWLAEHDGVGVGTPSCTLRRQRGRTELKKRINAEKRRLASIAKAVEKYRPERMARRAAQVDALF